MKIVFKYFDDKEDGMVTIPLIDIKYIKIIKEDEDFKISMHENIMEIK